MKTKIKMLDSNMIPITNAKWWSWEQTCNRCGNISQYLSEISSEKPDARGVDFCCRCMKYFFDNNIFYEEAKRLYNNNK